MLVKSAYAGSLSDETDTIPDGAPVATEPMSTEDGRTPVNSQVSTVGNPAKPVKKPESRSQLLRRRFLMAVKHYPYSVKVQRLTWLLENDKENHRDFLLKSGYYIPSSVGRGPMSLRSFFLTRCRIVYNMAYQYFADSNYAADFICSDFRGIIDLAHFDKAAMQVSCSLLRHLGIEPGQLVDSIVFGKTPGLSVRGTVQETVGEKELCHVIQSLPGSYGFSCRDINKEISIISFGCAAVDPIRNVLGFCEPMIAEYVKAKVRLDRVAKRLGADS